MTMMPMEKRSCFWLMPLWVDLL